MFFGFVLKTKLFFLQFFKPQKLSFPHLIKLVIFLLKNIESYWGRDMHEVIVISVRTFSSSFLTEHRNF